MKVFKFGGASVQNEEGIKNVVKIIEQHNEKGLIVVVSAMGKTTNALEKVVNAYCNHQKEEALSLFEQIKQQHLKIANYLLVKEANKTNEKLQRFFTEVEWLLHDEPVRNYDYYYDQIVSIGELLSTCLVNAYLNEKNNTTQWLDIRDYFRTDNNFREAAIDLEFTSNKIAGLSLADQITITQGFIGCTAENESTTLGREGSDYTAAVIASIIQAESVTIWKDVMGVLNADPKTFDNTVLLPELSYHEVIEMAYYGAQVIHPKTIKPLYNASIPLYVKCFSDTTLPGTIIQNKTSKNLPPIIVLKTNQVYIELEAKDYSFVGEQLMAELYAIFANLKLKPNLIQTGAISVIICLDSHDEKIEKLAIQVSRHFEVMIQKGLSILTIRHYKKEIMEQLTEGKTFILQQKTKETYQAIFA